MKNDVGKPFHFSQYVPWVSAAIGACFIGVFVLWQVRHHDHIIDDAYSDLEITSALLSEHMTQTFDTAEKALLAAAQVRKDAVAFGYDQATSHKLLKALHGGSPIFRTLAWTDANGNVTASSTFNDSKPYNIAFTPFFQAAREDPAIATKMYVGRTLFSKRLDAWTFVLALRLNDAEGNFAGVVGSPINLEYFNRVDKRARLGQTGIIQLLRKNGVALTREPFNAAQFEEAWADRGISTKPTDNPMSVAFHSLGLDDADTRIFGISAVAGGGAYLAVSKSRTEILEEFWQDLIYAGIILFLVVLALGTSAGVIHRQLRRQEKLEKDLQLSHRRFEDFADSASDWFWETDENHQFVWVSEGVEKAVGQPPSWYIGKSMVAVSNDDAESEACLQHLDAINNHHPFRDFEYRRQGPDGDHWITGSGVPIFENDGRFAGYRGSARNTSELRRAERVLNDAIRAFPGRFMMFDKDERMTLANRTSIAPVSDIGNHLHLGESFETITRRLVSAGLMNDAKDDPKGWIAWRMARYREPGDNFVLDIQDRMIEVIERPTHDGGMISLRFDVTERERAIKADKEAREAADLANQAKSDFLASMSHELRTPLNAVIGFAQILGIDQDKTLTLEQKEYAEIIAKSGQHLLNLVTEILDLAGIEAGHLRLALEDVNVATAVEEALTTIAPAAEKAGIQIEPFVGSNILSARADAQRLRQILLNLLSNAVKYNRENGTIAITARFFDKRVRIAIIDTGIGIAPEVAADAFVPFNRLGAEGSNIEGAGIGLSLCKRLIEAMGGTIHFVSEPGVGSTFTIDLPTGEEKDAHIDAPQFEASATTTQSGQYSLLYVEDNLENLSLIQHLVATLDDVEMLSAQNGPEGLEIARTKHPDIIVLDLNLPGMSGLEILQHIKADETLRNTPVIALTAAAMPIDVKRGQAAGFYRYVTKPLDVTAFLAIIDSALAEGSASKRLPLSPEIPESKAETG
ncbi:MAG: ATP-binding protein [Alphaproteobacteria bacterium]